MSWPCYGLLVADAPQPLPVCPRCLSADAVTRREMPDYPNIRNYHCRACAWNWMTTRQGILLVSGPDNGGE